MMHMNLLERDTRESGVPYTGYGAPGALQVSFPGALLGIGSGRSLAFREDNL